MIVVLGPHALLRASRMLWQGGNSLDDIKIAESCRYFFGKNTGPWSKIPTLEGKMHVGLQISREKIIR